MNKRAKRIVGVLLSLTLMLAMSVSVFAASPTGNGLLSGAKDSNGKDVKYTYMDYNATVDAANKAIAAGQVKVPAGMTAQEAINVQGPEGYVKGTAITITFSVAGVKPGMKVGALHQTDAGNWEWLDGTAGEGTVTIYFPNGLSPVILCVNEGGTTKTLSTSATKTGASPKTGEFGTTSTLAVLAVLAIGGAAVCYRKREEVR